MICGLTIFDANTVGVVRVDDFVSVVVLFSVLLAVTDVVSSSPSGRDDSPSFLLFVLFVAPVGVCVLDACLTVVGLVLLSGNASFVVLFCMIGDSFFVVRFLLTLFFFRDVDVVVVVDDDGETDDPETSIAEDDDVSLGDSSSSLSSSSAAPVVDDDSKSSCFIISVSRLLPPRIKPKYAYVDWEIPQPVVVARLCCCDA